MAERKKSNRTKRSRLGRGLSALVESPAAIEVAAPEVQPADLKSDNLSGRKSGVGQNAESDGGSGSGNGNGNGNGVDSVDGSGGGGSRRDEGSPQRNDGDGAGEALPKHVSNFKSSRDEGLTGDLGDQRGDGQGEGASDAVNMGARRGDADGSLGSRSGSSASAGAGAGAGIEGGVVEIPVGLVSGNRDQPRSAFDEESLGELAASIREHGVMQPISVRVVDPVAGGDQGGGLSYELIAGERRLRASVLAGLTTVPAIVRVVDDATSAQLALIENVQREDLNVVELALGYRSLSDRYSMTQAEISKTVGVSRSSVANVMRLLELPNEVRILVSEGVLSGGHGKALLSLGSSEKQRKFAARCIKEGWSVRELERQCNAEMEAGGDSERGGLDGDGSGDGGGERDQAANVLRDLEERIGVELSTRVKIRTDKSRTRGRVVIEFYDLDQFDGLLGKLGVRVEG